MKRLAPITMRVRQTATTIRVPAGDGWRDATEQDIGRLILDGVLAKLADQTAEAPKSKQVKP